MVAIDSNTNVLILLKTLSLGSTDDVFEQTIFCSLFKFQTVLGSIEKARRFKFYNYIVIAGVTPRTLRIKVDPKPVLKSRYPGHPDLLLITPRAIALGLNCIKYLLEHVSIPS